jgi:hypothetical protein
VEDLLEEREKRLSDVDIEKGANAGEDHRK